MSKKKYIVRCPRCNHGVFDADYADVEIKCPECKKVLFCDNVIILFIFRLLAG